MHLAKCVQWSEDNFWELVPSFEAGFPLLFLPLSCVLSVSWPVNFHAILFFPSPHRSARTQINTTVIVYVDSRSPTQAIRHSQQGLYPSELYPWDPTIFSILLSRESYLCTGDSSQGLSRLSEVDVHFPQQSTRALRLCVANDKGHYMLVWIQTEASGLSQVTRDRMVAAALTVAHGDPGKSSRTLYTIHWYFMLLL